MNTNCPSSDILIQFVAATLADAEADEVLSHLESCEACAKRLRALEQSPNEAVLAGFRQLHDKSLTAGSTLPKRIGKYEILEKIGEGGMGTVYRARHPELDRDVVVKTLKSSKLDDISARSRFEQEIKAVGRLRHRNIVQPLDAGTEDGMPFIVMELLDGCDLAAYVKQHGPMSPEKALNVIRQVADGLEHAHRAGLVHRDIKPSNLFLLQDGTAKLLDLGIAKPVGTNDSEKQTVTGHVVGSPDFMAPEQFRGAAVDARSDIYSLGCTLAYLMTDKSLSDFQTDLPETVRLLVARMTAGMPDQRFQSAKELIEAIDSLSKIGQKLKAKRILTVAGIALVFCIVLMPSLFRGRNEVERHDEITPVIDTNPIEQEIDNENSSPIDELNREFIEAFRKDEPRLRREATAYQKAMDQYKEESNNYTNAMYEWKKKNTGEYPFPPPVQPDPPEFMRKHWEAQEELYKKTPEYQAYLKEKDEWEKEVTEHQKQYDAWERDPRSHPRPSPLRQKPFPPVRPVPPPSPPIRSVPSSMPP